MGSAFNEAIARDAQAVRTLRSADQPVARARALGVRWKSSCRSRTKRWRWDYGP